MTESLKYVESNNDVDRCNLQEPWQYVPEHFCVDGSYTGDGVRPLLGIEAKASVIVTFAGPGVSR